MDDAPDMMALRALRDCGVIAASWDHPGYRLLRRRQYVTYEYLGDRRYAYRLTDRGRGHARMLRYWPPRHF